MDRHNLKLSDAEWATLQKLARLVAAEFGVLTVSTRQVFQRISQFYINGVENDEKTRSRK